MRPLPPELEAKIDEVKSWMFEGDQHRVAKKSRKSREWVNKVLNKKAFNAQVLVAAIKAMNGFWTVRWWQMGMVLLNLLYTNRKHAMQRT